jgi:hypothetical protein
MMAIVIKALNCNYFTAMLTSISSTEAPPHHLKLEYMINAIARASKSDHLHHHSFAGL